MGREDGGGYHAGGAECNAGCIEGIAIMMILIDDEQVPMSPQGINWGEPPLLAKDGNRAPIVSAYWTCRLSIPLTTTVAHEQWFDLRDGASHTFLLPHHATGIMLLYDAYVDSIVGRFDTRDECEPAMTGVDMMLSGIVMPGTTP